VTPNRNKTLTGLPRLAPGNLTELDHEPFPLRPRLVPLNKPSDTWPSRPTPTDLPRACRLEVTTQIVRRQRVNWAEFAISFAAAVVLGGLLLWAVMP